MIAGVNIDPRFAKPIPYDLLQGMGFVRFEYRVSLGRGNTSLAEPNAVYGPLLTALHARGVRPIVVLTHETWGDQQGFDWEAMTTADWKRLAIGFTEMCAQIAKMYAGRGIVYQIWNEQDQGSDSAVGVPPFIYGGIYTQARARIAALDPTATVILGGMCSGIETASAYFNATGIGVNHDGIAYHPYGATAAGYGHTPSFADHFRKLLALPRKPLAKLWLTEFGQPGNKSATDAGLAPYAQAALASASPDVAALCWFALYDGQHTSVGMIAGDGNVREQLRAALVGAQHPAEDTSTSSSDTYSPVMGLTATLNVRDMPSLAGRVVTTIANGSRIMPLGEVVEDGGHRWVRIAVEGGPQGWASSRAAGVLMVTI